LTTIWPESGGNNGIPLTEGGGTATNYRVECLRVGYLVGKEPSAMEDSDRRPLTAREKKIIFGTLLLTLIMLGLWIFAIVWSLPITGHGIL
jgi:hypothetical protein